MRPGAFWLMMLGMAFFAYLFRASFLLLGERMTLPPLLRRALDYVPAAVLAALVLPVFVDLGRPWAPADTARLVAGALAAAVAYRTRSVPATLAVGMGALWLTVWLLPGA
ncbi:MAG: AzlD domain-containing protein [Deinococcales bacterium]